MIPTDSDYHRERDAQGRDELVKRVRQKIDALGVDYIYYQYISITGRVMGKAAPSRHWEFPGVQGRADLDGRRVQRYSELSGRPDRL